MTNSSDTSLTGPAQHVLQRQGEYSALRCSGTRKVSFTLFFLQNGCQKWNQRVQKWGIVCIMWHHCWRIFDSFIAGSSAAFVLTVHHVCTLIECNRFFVWLFFVLRRLALYVYEYLLHVGAQKSAQTFLNEVKSFETLFAFPVVRMQVDFIVDAQHATRRREQLTLMATEG